MHCGNSLLRTEFVHEVGKHIKAYVVMPWIGYNIGKRIAGSKAFFHAVSKLCITFTFCAGKLTEQPAKVFSRSVSWLKIITEDVVGCLYERIFLCCDRTFISMTKFMKRNPVFHQISLKTFSVVGTVVGRIIGLSGTMSICLDEKFRPDILIPWIFCIIVKTGISIVLFYKGCIPVQHLIQCFKTVNFFFVAIGRVQNVILITDRNKERCSTSLYDRKWCLAFIPGLKKRLLRISITIVWDFFQIVGPSVFDNRLNGRIFRCCDKRHAVGTFFSIITGERIG